MRQSLGLDVETDLGQIFHLFNTEMPTTTETARWVNNSDGKIEKWGKMKIANLEREIGVRTKWENFPISAHRREKVWLKIRAFDYLAIKLGKKCKFNHMSWSIFQGIESVSLSGCNEPLLIENQIFLGGPPLKEKRRSLTIPFISKGKGDNFMAPLTLVWRKRRRLNQVAKNVRINSYRNRRERDGFRIIFTHCIAY